MLHQTLETRNPMEKVVNQRVLKSESNEPFETVEFKTQQYFNRAL